MSGLTSTRVQCWATLFTTLFSHPVQLASAGAAFITWSSGSSGAAGSEHKNRGYSVFASASSGKLRRLHVSCTKYPRRGQIDTAAPVHLYNDMSNVFNTAETRVRMPKPFIRKSYALDTQLGDRMTCPTACYWRICVCSTLSSMHKTPSL